MIKFLLLNLAENVKPIRANLRVSPKSSSRRLASTFGKRFSRYTGSVTDRRGHASSSRRNFSTTLLNDDYRKILKLGAVLFLFAALNPLFNANAQSDSDDDLYGSAARLRLSRFLADSTNNVELPSTSVRRSQKVPLQFNRRSIRSSGRYPWKSQIVTTIFWIGESATRNNPVANAQSSWDRRWLINYGGYDEPSPRRNYIPLTFIPRQNPFYVALPYNDIEGGHTKHEAPYVIPWFKESFVRDGQTTLKDRWIAIRHGNRIAYAQWEDCGPFRTDHWQYVFGPERPRPNLNQGAGLDVSPAVRDYLGLGSKDLCDWKFVDFREVPSGPWSLYGDNNTFVLLNRQGDSRFSRLLIGKGAKKSLLTSSLAN